MFTNVHGMMEISCMTIDDVFAFSVTQDIIDDDEIEPRSVAKCQSRLAEMEGCKNASFWSGSVMPTDC